MTESRRRFPPPWIVEEYRGISYIVRDTNDFAVAYVYFESEPGRRAAANLMTKDEARKIAAGPNIQRIRRQICAPHQGEYVQKGTLSAERV